MGATGYALIEPDVGPRLIEAGIIRTDPKQELPVRVHTIWMGIIEILDEFKPSILALEALYSDYRYPKSALQMAHARGVICAAAASRNVPVRDFAARDMKMAIVGYGAAKKEQVRGMVQQILKIEDGKYPLDVSDAMAIALTCVHRSKTRD